MDAIYIKKEKKFCSRIGWGFALMLGIVSLIQVGISAYVGIFCPSLMQEEYWLFFLLEMLPTYIIGFPVLFLVTKGVKKEEIERRHLKVKDFFVFLCMTYFLMIAGSIIGNIVDMALGALLGHTITTDLDALLSQLNTWTNVLVVVILAPIFEELMFRKVLIDRMIRYGEGVAIVVSGLFFGLFHGNFTQFFYATFLGMLFGYIYVKTGNVKLTMLLHAIVNGGSTWMSYELGAMTQGIDSISTLTEYTALLYLLAILGLIFFIIFRKRMHCEQRVICLEKKERFKVLWLNSGVIVYTLGCLVLFVMTLLVS